MDTDLMTRVLLGVGAIGILGGLLIVIQLPAANQMHETTLAATGIGVLLVLFGSKTVAESLQESD